MKKLPRAYSFVNALIGITVLSSAIVTLHSCQKESKQTTKDLKTLKNESQKKGDVTTNSVPLYCEDLENPCTDPACQPYYNCEPEVPAEVDAFRYSSDFSSFSNLNQTITSKISYSGGQVRNDYNNLLSQNLKTIHLPVIETNGDTTGMIIGVPTTEGGITDYLIFYQNNQLLTRGTSGYYQGEVGFDLFKSTSSYTVQINENSETINDTLISGPRWINNGSTAARIVRPTWDCIDNVMDKFWERCTGFCRFLCRASDLYFGTCSGGQYLGAATYCARHNNDHASY